VGRVRTDESGASAIGVGSLRCGAACGWNGGAPAYAAHVHRTPSFVGPQQRSLRLLRCDAQARHPCHYGIRGLILVRYPLPRRPSHGLVLHVEGGYSATRIPSTGRVQGEPWPWSAHNESGMALADRGGKPVTLGLHEPPLGTSNARSDARPWWKLAWKGLRGAAKSASQGPCEWSIFGHRHPHAAARRGAEALDAKSSL
jgi:hypothetical protein